MKALYFLAVALALGLEVQAAALADKVRVLSVDLQNTRVETPGSPGSELSQELRKLLENADVDVVCVQGAIDWENCERVCQLKPGLQVLTCSAFADAPQVAILARTGAVLSWVEEVQGGGFALSILQSGSRKLGVFSVQSAKSGSATVPSVTERLIPEVKKLQKFPQNRPDSFLVAGSAMSKTTVLTDNAFQSVAPEPRVENGVEFWVLNGGFLTRPRTFNLPGLRTPVSLCDFDTGSSFSSKFAYQTPLLLPGETLASIQPPPPAAVVPRPNNRTLWIASIAAAVLLALVLLLRRGSAPTMQLVPLSSAGNGTGLAPVNDPVRSNLLAWIKSAFLQRLISQRQQLLTNEAEATRRTMVIEEKLTSLQSALQTRISAYEARIERLEQELTAATLDNRELIRAQIELLKEKVAKAKEEHGLGRN